MLRYAQILPAERAFEVCEMPLHRRHEPRLSCARGSLEWLEGDVRIECTITSVCNAARLRKVECAVE